MVACPPFFLVSIGLILKAMIGQVVSHYKILGKLGEGGMGVVYKALDLRLNRSVALKFVPPQTQKDSTEMARFQHEAQAIAALNHPHIATIHSLEERDGRKFIVLEYLEGGTLREKLKVGRLPINTVLDYAVRIGEGLAHAHKSGIVHRDLKTENIMLTVGGQPKITDFGLAKLLGTTKITRTGSTAGTAAYMSPEQARGEEVDSRSDIFSFGVVLYELMTGQLPFQGEHEAAILYEILHETPRPMYELRADMPAAFEKIVEKALEKKAGRRYQKVEDMLGDLRGISASDKTTSRVAKILKKSRRWAIPIAALLLVSLIPVFKRYFFPAAPVSLAVLPFEVIGGSSEEQAWLAEGIGQSIASKLTKLKDVRVTPWMTSQRYRGGLLSFKDSLKELASELGVERLIVGTIRILGGRLQASVQLIDPNANQQLWAEEFEEDAANIFAVQAKIALGTAEELKGTLSGDEERLMAQPPAQRADAYELYIKGSLKLQSETLEDDNVALAYFDKAIELDPKLAEAYVGRGAGHEDRFFYGWGGKEDLDEAEENFKRALELDPRSSSAQRGLIWTLAERGLSEEVLKQGAAVSKDENDIGALSVRADAYFAGGLPDKAVPLYDRIMQLDPADNGALWHQVIALTWSLQPEKAIDAGEIYFEKFGEDPEVHIQVGDAYQALGDLDAAKIHYERGIALYGENFYGRGAALPVVRLYLRIGDTTKATSQLTRFINFVEERLRAYPSNFRMTQFLANCHATLGDYDKSDKFVEQTLQSSNVNDDIWPALILSLKASRSKTAHAIIQDWLSNGTNVLFSLRDHQAEGFIGQSELSMLRKEGILDKLVALDSRLRAKY